MFVNMWVNFSHESCNALMLYSDILGKLRRDEDIYEFLIKQLRGIWGLIMAQLTHE